MQTDHVLKRLQHILPCELCFYLSIHILIHFLKANWIVAIAIPSAPSAWSPLVGRLIMLALTHQECLKHKTYSLYLVKSYTLSMRNLSPCTSLISVWHGEYPEIVCHFCPWGPLAPPASPYLAVEVHMSFSLTKNDTLMPPSCKWGFTSII
jgi:hypothetical protein